MTIYELMKARHAIESKREELRKGYEVASERMRTYYNERVAPAESDHGIDLDELNAIYDTYDDLCGTCSKLGEQMDIATEAIEALEKAERILCIAVEEKVWEEG